MEKAAARRNVGSGLASMKEVQETEELQDMEAQDEKRYIHLAVIIIIIIIVIVIISCILSYSSLTGFTLKQMLLKYNQLQDNCNI